MLLKYHARKDYFLNCFLWPNNYEAWKEIWLIIKLAMFKTFSIDFCLLAPVSTGWEAILCGLQKLPKGSGRFGDNKSNTVRVISVECCIYVSLLASSWSLDPHPGFCMYSLSLHCYYQMPSKNLRDEGLILSHGLRGCSKLWHWRHGRGRGTTNCYPQ